MSNGQLVPKRGVGQPTKFTPDRCEKILTAARQGNYLETACQFAGISYGCLANWRKQAERDGEASPYFQFFEDLKLAQAEGELAMVQVIRKSAHEKGNWVAAMTFLERRYPKRWARQSRDKIEITTNESTVSVDGIRAAILAAIAREQPADGQADQRDRIIDGTATRRDDGDNGRGDSTPATNGEQPS